MDMLVNKKTIFCSLIIFICCVLTSCAPMVNAHKEAEEAVAAVIEYVNKDDPEGLINLFCDDVKENYELTSEVEKLFDMFDSDITSYDITALSSEKKSDRSGKGYYCIKAIVFAKAGNNEYRIEVSKTIYNDKKAQRMGLTTVMAMDENVKEMLFVGEVNVFT